jgi:hypothetical protein
MSKLSAHWGRTERALRSAGHDPLALPLDAQSAQLDGDQEDAKAAFSVTLSRGTDLEDSC